jgi:hypothetical protein
MSATLGLVTRQAWDDCVFASTFIIVISSALFCYWFRYTTLRLIQQGSADYALKVASTIRLSFPQVQKALQVESHLAVIDGFHESLENDYHILTNLLRQATTTYSIERRILTIDYKLLRVWYKLSRISPGFLRSRKTLAEMSSILSYFAAEIAQNSAS